MALKNFNHRTESLLNIILNNLLRNGKWLEGRPWTKISQTSLGKALKCTPDCVSLHVCKLVSEGILFRKKLNASEHDHTNYYSISVVILEDVTLKEFFNKSITKKIRTLYNIDNKSLINQSRPARNEGLLDMVSRSKEAFPISAKEVTKEKSTIAQDMLKIWNEEFEQKCGLSKHLSKYLVASYQRKFSSLIKWREYVCGLKRSKYVANKLLNHFGNKLLSWALSFKVINRIFSGGFGVTIGEALGVNPEDDIEISETEIDSLKESEECKSLRKAALLKYGKTIYKSWFTKLLLEQYEDKILLRGASFITSSVKLRFLNADDKYVDAGIFIQSGDC